MKLKFILLALLWVGLVKSVPLIENVPLVDDESDYLGFMMKNGKFVDEEPLNYRLPNDSIPLRYDLWLKTDVDKGMFNFSGRVMIRLKIVEPTQVITLHYRQTSIGKIDLRNSLGIVDTPNLVFVFEPIVEFVRITLPTVKAVDEEWILDIEYEGNLREDGSGFYRASYLDKETGTSVWFATTQFAMTDARHAMPCYDEPGIRAVTSLKIEHGKDYNAISNMPVKTRTQVGLTDNVETVFQDTVSMQSYLLAFIISDFAYVSDNDVKTTQRIYADPQFIKLGHGDFALTAVGPVLRQLEETLGVDYPLPKMDHAAITDYIWGAMENFGLITYQDSALLFDPINDPESKKIGIIEIIAHEYAHQYFGNIVSPSWWAYTWLNEGFATLLSYLIPELVFPTNNHIGRFTNAQNAAFSADVESRWTVPLNFYVQTPDNIVQKFNAISYQKGGSVLMMFMEALSSKTFLKGLNYYLTDMYFKSATPDDLHRNLQRAYDEAIPFNGINIGAMMSTWEVQSGYPLVHVEKVGGQFFLTQSRVEGGDEIYSIPIAYTVKSEADFEKKTVKMWMTTKTTSFTSGEDWTILNIQSRGYYKVSYGSSIYEAFAVTLSDVDDRIRSSIPAAHRLELFRSLRPALSEEKVTAISALEMMKSLHFEKVPPIVNEIVNIDNFFSNKIFGTDLLADYQNHTRSLTRLHLDRLGYSPKVDDTPDDIALRSAITSLNCKHLDPDCLFYERNRLADAIESGTGSYNLCNGIKTAYSSLFTMMLNRMLGLVTVNERATYVSNLGCSMDKNLLKGLLETTLDSTNVLSSIERRDIILNTFGKSVVGFETAVQFIEERFVEIEQV